MAKLYAMSPDGNSATIQLETMNIVDSGTSSNFWVKFPNGLLLTSGHFTVTSNAIDEYGTFSWNLPLHHWNTRGIFTSCFTSTREKMMSLNIWNVSSSKIEFASFVNGVKNSSKYEFIFEGLMLDWIGRSPSS